MIPYDKRSGKIWYNNQLVDWADAKVHILNHGLHYASCVFEGTLQDFFTQQKEWVLKFHTQNKK